MKRLSLELPRFRLELKYKFVKRRKPLVSEPLVPSVKHINRKYRTGSILGKFARHFTGHRRARTLFAGGLSAAVILTSFSPFTSVKAKDLSQTDSNVIQATTPLLTEKGIQFPVDNVTINQGFSFYHPGVDLGAPIGTPVKPIKSGVVTFAGYRLDGYGNLIVLNDGKGIESYYAHLSKIEVKQGEAVNTNMEIGQVGVTGHSTGPHLHLEIHLNGVPVNPLFVLPR